MNGQNPIYRIPGSHHASSNLFASFHRRISCVPSIVSLRSSRAFDSRNILVRWINLCCPFLLPFFASICLLIRVLLMCRGLIKGGSRFEGLGEYLEANGKKCGALSAPRATSTFLGKRSSLFHTFRSTPL